MSSFKETEIHAVASTQSIAQAPAFDNQLSCVEKAKIPPPRLKIVSEFDMTQPGAWKVRQTLYRDLCRTEAGRVPIEQAELYADILSIWQGKGTVQNFNKRDGCYYWGRTIADWAKKYKCTERHLKWLLKGLRDSGLIASCVMKKPGNKLHVRPLVAEGSACLSGWPDQHNYAHLLKAQSQVQQGIAGEKCPNAEGHKVSECPSAESVLTKNLGLACSPGMYESSDPVQASPDTTSPAGDFSEQPGKASQIQNQGKTQTLPEALPPIPHSPLSPAPGSSGFSTVVDAWVRAMNHHWPDHACLLTDRQPAIIKSIRRRVFAEAIDWADFLSIVLPPLAFRYAAPTGLATYPTPEFTTKHLPELLAYYRKNNPVALAAKHAAQQQAIAKADAEIEAAQAAKAAAPEQHESEFVAALLLQKAKQKAKAALVPEPVVAHVLDADDFEECDEPPLEVERAPLTQIQLLEAVKARELARLAAKSKATLFQSKVKA